MNQSVRGAIAGVLATIPMSAVMWAGNAAGLMRTPPPVEITANVEGETGAAAALATVPFSVRIAAAHLAYGAACGLVYPHVRPMLSGQPGAAGPLFGLAVWAVSYGGLMPALGLYPEPRADRHTRTAVMIAAHLVYGASLDAVATRLGAVTQ